MDGGMHFSHTKREKELFARRDMRMLFRQHVFIQFLHESKRLAMCQDLSISGIKVLTHGKYKLKKTCSIEIIVEPYGLTLDLLGTTVRVKKGEAAIKFINVKSHEKNFLNFLMAHYCEFKES
jgi:hypothetical protein